MAAPYTLGFMLLQDNNIRIRVYSTDPTYSAFDFQWNIPQTDWKTILTAVGTGTLGEEAGTVDVENFTADYGKSSGQVGSLEAAQ